MSLMKWWLGEDLLQSDRGWVRSLKLGMVRRQVADMPERVASIGDRLNGYGK